MSSFSWDETGSDLPIVEEHTKARHRVTEDYVKDWIITLCGNNIGKSKKVTIIDGFCGGGMYMDGENNLPWPGSPIRLIEGVKQGLEFVRENKGKPDYALSAKFIFIDNKKAHIDCLKKQLSDVGLHEYVNDQNICEFVCSDFESVLPKLLSELKDRKGSSLFILDPTGYTDVSMDAIRSIIALGKSEILYTFMIEYIVRFIRLRESELRRAFTDILEAEGFFGDLDSGEDFNSQDKKGYIRNEVLRLFRSRGQAAFAYSFALLPSSNTVKYYLIHLASNPTAQRVIKLSLWHHNNLDLAYQYRYETHGLGFKRTDYYVSNLNLFNISDENASACIQKLGDDLIPLIDSRDDGISFKHLHDVTMQRNPATINHYQEYLNLQREYNEIEIIRDGKSTKAKNILPNDLVVRPRQKSLFDMKNYHV